MRRLASGLRRRQQAPEPLAIGRSRYGLTIGGLNCWRHVTGSPHVTQRVEAQPQGHIARLQVIP